MVRELCSRTQRSAQSWDASDGFKWLSTPDGSPLSARDPLTALEKIDQSDININSIFILKDFHDAWKNPQIKRKLRSVCQRLKFTKKSILITTPFNDLPQELKDEAVIIEFPLPTAEAIGRRVGKPDPHPGRQSKSDSIRTRKTGAGRSRADCRPRPNVSLPVPLLAMVCWMTAILAWVTEEKKQIIRESEALEFYSVSETPDDVGGLGSAERLAADARARLLT